MRGTKDSEAEAVLLASGAREKEVSPRTDSSALQPLPLLQLCHVRSSQRDSETIEHSIQRFHGNEDGYSKPPEIGTSKRNLLIP